MKEFNSYARHNKKIVCIIATVFVALLLILFINLSVSSNVANADSIQEIKAEMAAMGPELDRLSRDYYEALREQQEAEEKRNEAAQIIEENGQKIHNLQGDISERMKQMYRNNYTSNVLGWLFSAQSLKEFIGLLDILNERNTKDALMVSESKALREETQKQKAVYDESYAKATEKATEAGTIKGNAEATLNNLQRRLDSLTAAERQAADEAARREAHDSGKGQGGGGGGGGVTPVPGGGEGAILARAQSCVGKVPYVWGGCSPSGADCSGFVSYCCCGAWTRIGSTVTFMGWPRAGAPVAGNVCTNREHCGIFAGGGSMIHCPQPGEYVKYGPVQDRMIIVVYPH